MEKRQFDPSWRLNVLWWGAVLCLVWKIGPPLFSLVLPLLAGFAIAFFLKPCINWGCTHMHMRRKPAAVFIVILFYLVIGALLWIFILLLAGQINQLVHHLPELYQQTLPLLTYWNERAVELLSPLSAEMGSSVSTLLSSLTSSAPEAISSMTSALLGWGGRCLSCIPRYGISIGVTILSSIYFCADYRLVVDFLFRQLPPSWRPRLLSIKNFLTDCLLKMARAYFLIFLLTFLEVTAGLWLLRVDTFLLGGLFTAALDILPVIGSSLVLIPWGLFALIQGNQAQGLGILCLYGIVTVVRNFVEPKLVGDSVGLHPLLTLSSIFIGGKLLGGIGILLGPLLVLLLKYLNQTGVIHLYQE